MAHTDFVSVKSLESSCDSKALKKIKLADVKLFKVIKNNNKLYYKKSFEEETFKEVKYLKENTKKAPLNKIYTKPLPLKPQKEQDLHQLVKKKIIPAFYKTFYE